MPRTTRAGRSGHAGSTPGHPGHSAGSTPAAAKPPEGTITRGTTGINRLRRSDRWLTHNEQVRRVLTDSPDPLVVDLGYGARPDTTLELARRLRTIRPDLRVTGLEIDPARVVPSAENVTFARGGFELAGLRPNLVRAFNVLRQYPENAVPDAWSRILSGLAPGGLLVDGTCDELGRRCAWIVLDGTGPKSLTLAWDPFTVPTPSDIAERLPKALIHRNVPGEKIHALLQAADRAWATAAPLAPFGPRARWRAALTRLATTGVLVAEPRRRLRDNVLTVPWDAVRPND